MAEEESDDEGSTRSVDQEKVTKKVKCSLLKSQIVEEIYVAMH